MRPRLLDLFCGEGGAAMGYYRAGFNIFGVDNNAARLARYPFPHINMDALSFLAAGGLDSPWVGGGFDAIHASPPCTGYSRGTTALPDRLERYDRLIPATRDLLEQTGKPYVIENVEDAKAELHNPLTLCWTMLRTPGDVSDIDGTPLWMRRHRLFESNIDLWPPDECNHPTGMQCAGAYGGARRDKDEARNIRHGGYVPPAHVMGELLGIDWMSEKGLQLSIPPAYAQHIGEQLMAHVSGVAA